LTLQCGRVKLTALDTFDGGEVAVASFTITVNGVPRSFEADTETPLLWVLRDTLALTGTKYGCGEGLCGACTVHLDGDAVRSCITTVGEVGERRVTTIEGMAAAGHPLVRAWIAEQVPQCGYCQPGQIMHAAALLARTPDPTESELDDAMSTVLCRCGTYQRIRRAIRRVAAEAAR
jgi:isoquinoline 1-oxidoreductase alpha subunit